MCRRRNVNCRRNNRSSKRTFTRGTLCYGSYEITPSDELIPYIEEIKKVSIEKLGVLPHITIGRKDSDDIPILSEYSFEEYKKIWEPFESDLFNFKSKIFYQKRKEFCYAGDWSMYVNLVTGEARQCYCGCKIQNIYQNIEKPIKFMAIGNYCTQPHCYNGHAFLSFGNIPELETPTYDTLRNRTCSDGSMWLTKDMQDFMKGKLKDTNQEYTEKQKKKINRKNAGKLRQQKVKQRIKKIVRPDKTNLEEK